jgi:hypothetical protein
LWRFAEVCVGLWRFWRSLEVCGGDAVKPVKAEFMEVRSVEVRFVICGCL